MENSRFETTIEWIPTKEIVLEIISRFAENMVITSEKSDDKGLYRLETKLEGDKPGSFTEYLYLRKGNYPDGNSTSATEIHAIHYENDMPCSSDLLSSYNYEAQAWVDVE